MAARPRRCRCGGCCGGRCCCCCGRRRRCRSRCCGRRRRQHRRRRRHRHRRHRSRPSHRSHPQGRHRRRRRPTALPGARSSRAGGERLPAGQPVQPAGGDTTWTRTSEPCARSDCTRRAWKRSRRSARCRRRWTLTCARRGWRARRRGIPPERSRRLTGASRGQGIHQASRWRRRMRGGGWWRWRRNASR